MGDEVDAPWVDLHLDGPFGESGTAGIGLVDEAILLTDADGIPHQVAQERPMDDRTCKGNKAILEPDVISRPRV